MTKHNATGASSVGARETNTRDIGPFPVFDLAEMTKLSNRNLEVVSRAARAYLAGAAQLNRAMIEFANARLQKDIETTQAIASSPSSEEAFHTQAIFWEDAFRDYADGASTVLHIAADMAKETLTPVEERAEEMLHELEERADPQRPSAGAAAAE